MGFLDRFKNNREEEDDEEFDDDDDEEDDEEDDDEDDDDGEEDEEEGDDDEGSGGGFLGKFMGGKGGNKGIFGKVLKKGGSDEDDEDEEDDEDDEDAVALPASAPPVATGRESSEATSGSTVMPVAAGAEGLGGAASSSDGAPAPAGVGALAAESPVAAPDAPAPVEEPPQIDLDSIKETSKADEFDLNDLFGEKQEVDPRLKSLADSQENTPAADLAEELTSFLRELEEMMSD